MPAAVSSLGEPLRRYRADEEHALLGVARAPRPFTPTTTGNCYRMPSAPTSSLFRRPTILTPAAGTSTSAIRVLVIDEVRRKITNNLTDDNANSPISFRLPGKSRCALLAFMRAHSMFYEDAAKILWATLDDARHVLNLMVKNPASVVPARGIPYSVVLATYIRAVYVDGMDDHTTDATFHRFRFYCGLVRKLFASLDTIDAPLAATILDLLPENTPLFPNLQHLAWTGAHLPAIGFEEGTLRFITSPQTRSLRLYAPSTNGSVQTWTEDALRVVHNAIGSLQELHILATAPFTDQGPSMADRLHKSIAEFFRALHFSASRSVPPLLRKARGASIPWHSELAWPLHVFERRWNDFTGGFMALSVFDDESEEPIALPRSVEALSRAMFLAQHLHISDRTINLVCLLHSATLIQPIPAKPYSLLKVLGGTLTMMTLSTVIISLEGVSFDFTQAELMMLARVWPRLEEFRLSISLRSLDDIPDIYTIYRFVRYCPHLLYLQLPAITTADCHAVIPDPAALEQRTALLSLASATLVKLHSTEDVVDCLLRLFPGLQQVGSNQYSAIGAWQSVKRCLDDRRQREACSMAVTALGSAVWAQFVGSGGLDLQ
ncbi:hypothetical protein OH77DRAFT_1512365 [Trametes cingulata]|nr:hypothetical protein OH77DRAFT_1512365 [Trametes cingulata]